MISSTVSLTQSPYSRREAGGTTDQHSGDACTASPVDLAEASIPRESDGAPWLSWKKAGAALLLAAPIVAGAVTDAHAMVPPPTDPTVSCAPVGGVRDVFECKYTASSGLRPDWLCTPPRNAFSCEYTGPLSEGDVSVMKSLAAPSATDNTTAMRVREDYGKLANTVQEHVQKFKESLATLQAQEDVLKSYTDRIPGTYTDTDTTVVVEKGENVAENNASETWTKITLKTDKSIATLVETARLRLTTVTRSDQHISLLANVAVREIDDGNVKRSWFLMDGIGHSPGDFDVVVRNTRPLGPGYWQQHLFVHGASITNQTSERYSGFAGTLNLNTLDSFQVPDPSVPNPQGVQLREIKDKYSISSTSESINGRSQDVQDLRHIDTSEVEVRQDGSTRVRFGYDTPLVEKPGASAPVYGESWINGPLATAPVYDGEWEWRNAIGNHAPN